MSSNATGLIVIGGAALAAWLLTRGASSSSSQQAGPFSPYASPSSLGGGGGGSDALPSPATSPAVPTTYMAPDGSLQLRAASSPGLTTLQQQALTIAPAHGAAAVPITITRPGAAPVPGFVNSWADVLVGTHDVPGTILNPYIPNAATGQSDAPVPGSSRAAGSAQNGYPAPPMARMGAPGPAPAAAVATASSSVSYGPPPLAQLQQQAGHDDHAHMGPVVISPFTAFGRIVRGVF